MTPTYSSLGEYAHHAGDNQLYLFAAHNTAPYLQVNGLYNLNRQEKLLLAILSELVNIRTLLESSNSVISTEAEWDVYQRLRKEALDGYDQTLH
jgi:hypothetical protein